MTTLGFFGGDSTSCEQGASLYDLLHFGVIHAPPPRASARAMAPALPMPQDSRQRASKPSRQQAFASAKAPRLPILHDVTDKLEQLPPLTSAATACPRSPGVLPAEPSLQMTMATLPAAGRIVPKVKQHEDAAENKSRLRTAVRKRKVPAHGHGNKRRLICPPALADLSIVGALVSFTQAASFHTCYV